MGEGVNIFLISAEWTTTWENTLKKPAVHEKIALDLFQTNSTCYTKLKGKNKF